MRNDDMWDKIISRLIIIGIIKEIVLAVIWILRLF